ncbi:MAG: LacI family DNA-binding transcriptional regulator [Jiangellaceae bacterium]
MVDLVDAGRPAGAAGAGTTIRDVAAHAGVSIATVSRVMRGSTPVASATRDRVLASIADLGFRPSTLGRALAEGRHAANGIVFPDLSGPYYAEVVLGYEEVAGELGRSVLILSTHGRDAAPEMVRELAGRVDGLVVLGRTVSDDVVAEITDRGTPVVMIARPAAGDADSVKAENVQSARALTRHLLGHGHRRLVFLGDADRSPDTQERWSGFHAALTAAGLDPAAPVPAGFSEDEGRRAAGHLVAGGLPDAVVCADDELALGLVDGLRARGVTVPDDVAVTGWDDVMAARFAGLTTVSQPMRQLGTRAAQLLDLRVRGDDAPPRHEVLPTHLVVRTSCGRHHPTEESR